MLRQDNGQIFLDEKSGLQMHLPNRFSSPAAAYASAVLSPEGRGIG